MHGNIGSTETPQEIADRLNKERNELVEEVRRLREIIDRQNVTLEKYESMLSGA